MRRKNPSMRAYISIAQNQSRAADQIVLAITGLLVIWFMSAAVTWYVRTRTRETRRYCSWWWEWDNDRSTHTPTCRLPRGLVRLVRMEPFVGLRGRRVVLWAHNLSLSAAFASVGVALINEQSAPASVGRGEWMSTTPFVRSFACLLVRLPASLARKYACYQLLGAFPDSITERETCTRDLLSVN